MSELCKLGKLENLLKRSISYKCGENFYNAIHNKGIIMIKEGKMTAEEIINFMISQDIYYYCQTYKNSENRDPIIFSYIPIIDRDKDYAKILN